MFNPNIILPNMGKLDIDPHIDMGQFLADQSKRLKKSEEEAARFTEQIYKSDALYFNAFFALALSPRAQKRMAQLENSQPELFQNKANNRRVQLYDATHRTNNPEIDDCMASLLVLYDEESNEGGKPDKLLSIVRGAYPRIFNACQGTGENYNLGHIYAQILKLICPALPPKRKIP